MAGLVRTLYRECDRTHRLGFKFLKDGKVVFGHNVEMTSFYVPSFGPYLWLVPDGADIKDGIGVKTCKFEQGCMTNANQYGVWVEDVPGADS